jgi:riboflavin synthase
MFTGIVQGVGRVRSVEPRGGDVRMWIDTGGVPLVDVAIGGSIAVNGCCLTAVELEPAAFAADLSRETLSLTTAGQWSPGTPVNLEKALTAGQALGGHYVTGHVDGVGQVVSRHDDARSVRVEFEAPAELARYVARKGSICVDGVSLTVNGVAGNRFDVNLVPHTLGVTILGGFGPGTRVNLEVDIIARYLERLVAATG